MQNISTAFRDELNNDNRRYVKSCEITLKDGTKLSIDNSAMWSDGFQVEQSVSGTSGFEIGAAIIGKFTCVLNNIYDEYTDYDFTGAVVSDIQVGLELPDGNVESMQKGVFTVDNPEYNGSIITLECLDNMVKFDRDYSESKLNYPTTLGAIVRDACSCCNVSLAADSTMFDWNDYVVDTQPDDESLTFRQVLLWVGQISGLWCVCNALGQLSLGWYDTKTLELLQAGTGNPSAYHDIHSISSMDVCLDDVVITGVRVFEQVSKEGDEKDVMYQDGADGYVLSVDGNKLIQNGKGATVAGHLGAKVNGLRFRPFSVSCLSDPSIEAGDVAVITDRKGGRYITLITTTTFQPGNYQNISCDAESPVRKSAARYSKNAATYKEFRKQLHKNKTEWEKAVDGLGERMDNASGMYQTSEKQADGSTIYYLHNKPKLSESSVIIKITSQAIGISTDGGNTWPTGLTVDGEAIIKILQTVGVNADWINTGAITVKDEDGNVIFSVDMDTNQVVISGDYIRIGDRSASEAIDEALIEAKKGALSIVLDSEYQGISTDYNGNYKVFPHVKTKATVRYGQTDVSNECLYTVTESDGVTGSWNSTEKSYTVTALAADIGWIDITAKYLNQFGVTKRFCVEKVKGGRPGNPAKECRVTGEQVMKYGKDSDNPVPEVISLSVEYQNATHGKWQYKNVAGAWMDFSPQQVGKVLKVAENSVVWDGDSAVIRALDTEQDISDIITLAKLRDGDKGDKGDKGDQGTGGIGYTVLLSNETHVFSGSTSAALAGSAVTDVTAYKNTSKIVTSITKIGTVAISGNPGGVATGYAGLTATVSGNGTSACKITFSATTALVTKNGSIPITITVDDKTYIKYFSFSVSFKGQPGTDGRVFELEYSADIIKTGKEGVLNPSYLDFFAFYRDGNEEERKAYSGRFKVEETVNGSTWTTTYQSKANESSFRYGLYTFLTDGEGNALIDENGYGLAASREISSIRCTLYTAGGFQNVIYTQNISVVSDVESLMPGDIFDLLTDDGKMKGIYKIGGQLYVNATYLATGMLTDAKRKNYWNLDTGELSMSADTTVGGKTIKAIAEAEVDAQTQIDVFNKLTSNGAIKGLYMKNGQLYVSFTYAKGGNLDLGGSGNGNGKLRILGADGTQIGYMDNTGVNFNKGIFSGTVRACTVEGSVITGSTVDGCVVQSLSGSRSTAVKLMDGVINVYGSNKIVDFGGDSQLAGCIMGTYGFNMSDNTLETIGVLEINGEESIRIGSNKGDPYSYVRMNNQSILLQYSGYNLANVTLSRNGVTVGKLIAPGSKSRLVETPSYASRLQYCYEMPSPMFGDIGEAITDVMGQCVIAIDDVFLETVAAQIEYQVFLQKESQGDVWVDSKEPTFFVVKGTKNTKFAWEIKCIQRDYEFERLEEYDDSPEEKKINYESEYQAEIESLVKEREEPFDEVYALESG